MASDPITSGQIDGEKMETVTDFLSLGSKITMGSDHSHEIKRRSFLGRKAMTNLNNILKSRDITLPTKVHIIKAMVFSSSHVWMWELDHKEGWAPKNWCFWTVVLEKTLESPLDCKETKSVNPKGNKPWIFIGRTDAEVEASILWPPDMKSQLMKRSWCWERLRAGREGVTEDETLRWHRQFNGREVEPTAKDSEGQGSLTCCSPWNHKESDMTKQLNNNLTAHFEGTPS